MRLKIEVSSSNIKRPGAFAEVREFPCRLNVGDYIDIEGYWPLSKEDRVRSENVYYKDIGFRVSAVAFLYDAEKGWYQKVFI